MDAGGIDQPGALDTAPMDLPPDRPTRVKCASSGGQFGDPGNPWRNPVIRCQWKQDGVQAYSSPVVVDLDGDTNPEIIFPTQAADGAHLVAIRGTDCSLVWNVVSKIEATSEIAVGDLDGDGVPEVVGHGLREFMPPPAGMGKPSPPGPGGGEPLEGLYVLHAYSATGVYLGRSEPLPNGPYVASGPGIADMDATAPAEIVFAAGVYRLNIPAKKIDKIWDIETRMPTPGILSVAADVNLDGWPEVITGSRIHSGSNSDDLTPNELRKLPPGYAAIAQVDEMSPYPEIILASAPLGRPGSISVVDPDSGAVVFGPYDIPNMNSAQASAGPPVAADFDGDERVEFGLAGPDDYRMYDPDCTADPMPENCEGVGLRWTSKTTLNGSGTPSSTVFDFNGDCRPEVVYRDQCWLRIYDGQTGKVQSVASIGGTPHLEQPVVADVDADGHAEIVVSSSSGGGCTTEMHTMTPYTLNQPGVYVLADPENRWVGSRRVWNQHGYHVTNVDESGAIPATELNSWERYNNYRQNVPRP